jgi:hypothetical protein
VIDACYGPVESAAGAPKLTRRDKVALDQLDIEALEVVRSTRGLVREEVLEAPTDVVLLSDRDRARERGGNSSARSLRAKLRDALGMSHAQQAVDSLQWVLDREEGGLADRVWRACKWFRLPDIDRLDVVDACTSIPQLEPGETLASWLLQPTPKMLKRSGTALPSVMQVLSHIRARLSAFVSKAARETTTLFLRMSDVRPAFAFLDVRRRKAVSVRDLHTQLYRLGALMHDPTGLQPSSYVLSTLRQPGESLASVEQCAVERLFRELFGGKLLRKALFRTPVPPESAATAPPGPEGLVEPDWAVERQPCFAYHQFVRWALPLAPDLELVRAKMKDMLRSSARMGGGALDWPRAFARIDKDHSGTLSHSEFRAALGHSVLAGLDRVQVGLLIQTFDVDGDGSVDLKEFAGLVDSSTSE